MNKLTHKITAMFAKDQWMYSEGKWVFLVKIINIGLTFLTSVVLARTLGTRNFGIFTQVLAIISVVGAPTEIGLPQLMVRETARLVENRDWAKINGFWRWSVSIIIGTSVLFIIGYPLVRPFLGKLISEDLHEPLVWGMLLVPLFGVLAILSSGIRGFHRIAIAQVAEQVLLPGLFIGFLMVATTQGGYQVTPLLAILLQVGASFLSLGFGLFVLFRIAPGEIFKASPVYDRIEWLKSTLSLASISGMQILNKWLSLIIVGIFVKYAELGIYRVGIQIAILADFGRLILYPLLSSQISKYYAKNDMVHLQYLARLSARWIILINSAIYVLFFFFGKYFVNFFYGKEYKTAYTIVLILIAGQVVDSITGASSLFLTMTGFERDTAKIRFFTTTMNLVMIYVFSDLWGIVGAAIATAVSLIVWNVMIWFLVKKKLGINCLPI